MSKHDLKARPIYHRKLESIRAHLTLVFAALAIARYIEDKTGVSIRKFIRSLEEIRSGSVEILGKTYSGKARIPDEVADLVRRLSAGY